MRSPGGIDDLRSRHRGTLPDNKRYAVSANWGGYHGTNAFAATALLRINDNIVLNGGVGVGLTKGDVGGRVGVTTPPRTNWRSAPTDRCSYSQTARGRV